MEFLTTSTMSDGHVVPVATLSDSEMQALDAYQGRVAEDGLLFFRPFDESSETAVEWPDLFHSDRIGKSVTFTEMFSGEQFYFDRRFTDGRVYMFDPETGGRTHVAEDIFDFLDDYLLDDECMEFFRELMATTRFDDVCSLPKRVFGTTVPVFLGGSFDEREWIDRVTHFDVLSQIFRQVNPTSS